MPSKPLLLGAFVAALASPTVVRAQKAPPVDWAAFDRYVAQAAKDWKVPALAIAVVKDDSLVFAKGYGILEMGKPAPANEHTRFAIGSTTKAMTSASIAMLVDEGKLRWDDRVTDYIPELQLSDPYATHELTIRDLLTHRSGLPGTDLFWARWHFTLPEIIHGLRYIKPESSFRSNWSYQNVMYALSGTIIERASGMSWEAFVRSHIFVPLGMNETEALVSEIAGKPNVGIPHYLLNDTVRTVPMRSTDAIAPAGSVWSSVSDMSKWMRFVLDSGRVGSKRLIKASTFRELITPQIEAPMEEYPALQLSRPDFFSYGFGWFIQNYAGQQVWMHTGSIDGECAIIGLMPNEHLGVYVLENLDHAELRHALMYRAFDLYNGGPSRDWSADVSALFAGMRQRAGAGAPAAAQHVERPASVVIEKYAGTFVDSAYGTVTVTSANGKLRARVVTDPEADLDHWDVDSFRTHVPNPRDQVAVTFTPDGAGGISAVRVYGVSFARVRASPR
jgi:CubicO group peptidase (beta-lactamase class C family)